MAQIPRRNATANKSRLILVKSETKVETESERNFTIPVGCGGNDCGGTP